MYRKIIWPNNKKFAFTIFDDTDRSNLEDSKLIYNCLNDLGFKTTRSAWVNNSNSKNNSEGVTCENKSYLEWLLEIKKIGFEIGYHNTTFSSSERQKIIEGLEKFKRFFGEDPIVMANHSENKENIYWGSDRLSGSRKLVYNILTLFKRNKYYLGHDNSSKFFWGDLCKQNIKYVRNFVFSDINTLKNCPFMPYKDQTKPFVNYWFASSEGNNAETFIKCISGKNQDRLEEEGGACIMYTHFADGFSKNGKISENFKEQMTKLSKREGWFVTVSTLLEFLKKENKNYEINPKQRKALEWKWLFDKLILGST